MGPTEGGVMWPLSQQGGGGDGAGNPVDTATCVRPPDCSVPTVNSSEWDCCCTVYLQHTCKVKVQIAFP